jgi:hypothetical protein
MDMPSRRHPWVRIANFASGWEADLAVARLQGERVPARAMGNDVTGIFGPGFQGANARGFWVEVPQPLAARALDLLARPPAPPEDVDGETPPNE